MFCNIYSHFSYFQNIYFCLFNHVLLLPNTLYQAYTKHRLKIPRNSTYCYFVYYLHQIIYGQFDPMNFIKLIGHSNLTLYIYIYIYKVFNTHWMICNTIGTYCRFNLKLWNLFFFFWGRAYIYYQIKPRLIRVF